MAQELLSERLAATATPQAGGVLSPLPNLKELADRLPWRSGKRANLPEGDIPSVVRGSKSSATYLAHTYHTKVPPEVIEAAVRRFSHPGEVVLDPFAGSGMTGVGALRAGRVAILLDLSPAAVFLSRAHGTLVDVLAFERSVKRVTAAVAEEAAWLYSAPCASCGLRASLEKAIWSEVIRCPACGALVHVYRAALGPDRRIHQTFKCSSCDRLLRRGEGVRISWEMAELETRCGGCGRRRIEARPSDVAHVRRIERAGVPEGYWHPDDRITWGDMWRRGYHEGVERHSDFYTTRNLRMLAAIHQAISAERDARVRDALMFVFTNLVWHGSKMRRFNAFGGARPMNGALYLPAVFEEANLLTLWRHKARMVARHYQEIARFDPEALYVAVGSATDLSPIPDGSVDFVFTDPPYGGNILYSEVNALWEAWLLTETDPADEVVISKTQGKGIDDYRALLTRAFRECHRVLRPRRWMTLTFNTSYAEVWEALQRALLEAGFDVQYVQVLDKGHRSFKQLTSQAIAGYDIMVSAQRNGRRRTSKIPRRAPNEEIAERVRALRPSGPVDLRGLQTLYARVVASLLREGQLAAISIRDVARMLA